MAVEIITAADLPNTITDPVDPATLEAMLAGLNARAIRLAPCLGASDAEAGLLAEARLVLLGALKRWADAGAGAFQQQTAGPFSVALDTRQRGGYNLWPTEIDQLQALCRTGGGGAFTVDMTGLGTLTHPPLEGATRNARPGHEGGEWSPEADNPDLSGEE